ncbi:MAG: 4-(cytidine 5'-diphospho)-2-C-methyl-D-erythritol kinase [Paucibacter sp.]|nr:4-(cytidine 5'-diphospho)-2-C-methyl-D-erythritol kinase [Roseateles sp.]
MRALYDVPAPAKLNLFLHVVGKRADGYHLLESVFALIDWADTLHFERRDDGQLVRHDRGDTLPPDDLCLRAARLLQQATDCAMGADIHIEKRLPSGAGMGGGSSDAASVLLALNRLWGLNLPRAQLLALGLKLGADVPFFIGGRNAFVQGIGEVLTPIDLAPQTLAVLKPPVGIPTKEIFSSPFLARSDSSAIVAGFPAHELEANAEVLATRFVAQGRNDLQAAALAFAAEVGEALKLLESAESMHAQGDARGVARMTGSGSAVFMPVSGERGVLEQSMATLLQARPASWIGKICRSLDRHPLMDWAEG